MRAVDIRPAATEMTSRGTRALCGVLGLTSVVPLMAWVYGLGSFSAWLPAVTVPGTLTLVGLTVWRRAPAGARRIITVGVFAGLVGTIGYDVFRIPFVFGAGYRLLSSIESYGVLITDSPTSSGWTDFVGWAWHFSNGVGFAIAYVAVAERRRWTYGLAWAMVLESATVLTPFASYYHLRGNTDAILIAYAAHVPFGLAIGWAGQHAGEIFDGLRTMSTRPNMALVGASAVALYFWLQPLDSHRIDATPPEADAAVVRGRLHPEFVRVEPGDCVAIANLDGAQYSVAAADGAPTLRPNDTSVVCFSDAGVHRLPIDDLPFHGGWVIVDPALTQGDRS